MLTTSFTNAAPLTNQRLIGEMTLLSSHHDSPKPTIWTNENYSRFQMILDVSTILFCFLLIASIFVSALTQRIKDIETARNRAAIDGSSTSSRKNTTLL